MTITEEETMKPFENLREYDYEYAAAGRGDHDGKARARAFAERSRRALPPAKPPRPVGPIREVEEDKSRARRERASALRAEVAALIASAERRIDAALTTHGQLVAAFRRGL
jgi:hypothetical protein